MQPLPLWQQCLVFLLVPPGAAAAWWLMSRGLSITIRGGRQIPQDSKDVQNQAFWAFTILGYILALAIALYAHWARK